LGHFFHVNGNKYSTSDQTGRIGIILVIPQSADCHCLFSQ